VVYRIYYKIKIFKKNYQDNKYIPHIHQKSKEYKNSLLFHRDLYNRSITYILNDLYMSFERL